MVTTRVERRSTPHHERISVSIYAVSYVYEQNDEDLARVRPEHREFLAALHEEGTLLTSGPTFDAEGNRGALLVVTAGSAEAALDVLAADPIHVAGLVLERRALLWQPVFGDWAS